MKKQAVRECGSCTACCDGWLTLTVHGRVIDAGHPCPNVCEKGCSIYETRPIVCARFSCLWVAEGSLMPDWMRPDNSKVIVKLSRFGPYEYLSAVAVGQRVPPRSVEWLRKHCSSVGISLMCIGSVKKDGKYTNWRKAEGYGPSGFIALMERMGHSQLPYNMDDGMASDGDAAPGSK